MLEQPALASFQYLLFLLAIRRRLGQRHLQVGAVQRAPVERIHGLHGVVALLEMYKGVVLDLLDTLDRTVRFECFLQFVLGKILRQIAHIQDLDPGHGVVVWLFLRIGPVDDDVASKDFDTAGAQASFG